MSLQEENTENQKQYQKDLLLAVENDLKNAFENKFITRGVKNAYTYLTLKTTRDSLIKEITTNVAEYDYLDNNYEKILTKVKKIYENDEKAKKELLQQNLQRQLSELYDKKQAEQKEQIKINRIIFAILTLILAIGIIWFFIAFADYINVALIIIGIILIMAIFGIK